MKKIRYTIVQTIEYKNSIKYNIIFIGARSLLVYSSYLQTEQIISSAFGKKNSP